MHPRSQYDCPPDSNLLRLTQKIRNYDHFTIIACNRLAEDSLANAVLRLILTEFRQQLATIGVGVRVAMRHIHFIIVVLKSHLKLQTVIVAATLFLH